VENDRHAEDSESDCADSENGREGGHLLVRGHLPLRATAADQAEDDGQTATDESDESGQRDEPEDQACDGEAQCRDAEAVLRLNVLLYILRHWYPPSQGQAPTHEAWTLQTTWLTGMRTETKKRPSSLSTVGHSLDTKHGISSPSILRMALPRPSASISTILASFAISTPRSSPCRNSDTPGRSGKRGSRGHTCRAPGLRSGPAGSGGLPGPYPRGRSNWACSSPRGGTASCRSRRRAATRQATPEDG